MSGGVVSGALDHSSEQANVAATTHHSPLTTHHSPQPCGLFKAEHAIEILDGYAARAADEIVQRGQDHNSTANHSGRDVEEVRAVAVLR